MGRRPVTKPKKSKKQQTKAKARKSKASSEFEMPVGSALLFALLLFVPIVLGWFFMIDHIDEESRYSAYEPPLAEPYASFFKNFSGIYLIIGIVSVIAWFIAAVNANKRMDYLATVLASIPVILMGIGFMGDYLVALIKLEAPHLAFVYTGIIIMIIILQTALRFIKREQLGKLLGYSFLGIGILALLFLILAEPVDGRYIMTRRNRLYGSFSAKTLIWMIGYLGTSLIVGLYHFILEGHKNV